MKIGVATCKPGKQFERVRGTKDCEEETKIFSIQTLPLNPPLCKLCIPINFVFIQRTAMHSENGKRCMKGCPCSLPPEGANRLTCCSYLCLSSSNCQENSLDCFSRSDFDLLRSASTFSIYMVKEREYLIFFKKAQLETV